MLSWTQPMLSMLMVSEWWYCCNDDHWCECYWSCTWKECQTWRWHTNCLKTKPEFGKLPGSSLCHFPIPLSAPFHWWRCWLPPMGWKLQHPEWMHCHAFKKSQQKQVYLRPIAGPLDVFRATLLGAWTTGWFVGVSDHNTWYKMIKLENVFYLVGMAFDSTVQGLISVGSNWKHLSLDRLTTPPQHECAAFTSYIEDMLWPCRSWGCIPTFGCKGTWNVYQFTAAWQL